MMSNENSSMCAKCGGRCCKRYAGMYKYSELGKGYRDRLGEDLVVCVNLLLNPVVVLSSVDLLYGEQKKDILGKATNELELWNTLFSSSKNFSEFAFSVKPKQEKDRYAITTPLALMNMGSCVNLVEGKGCKLEYKDRPFGCKTLRPSFSGGVEKCTNDVENADLNIYRSWHREREFLESFVLNYVSKDEDIKNDKLYLENIVEPLRERYGNII